MTVTTLRPLTETATVLVVDDNEQLRLVITRILGGNGYATRTVASVEEARSALRDEHVDAVMCDVMMPGESGIDLLRYIRKAEPHLPVVIVSGITDPSFANTALELGAYGYVTKPFDENQLVIALANALHRATLERENREYRERLEWMVTDRTVELADTMHDLVAANDRLKYASESTIQALAQAIEGRDIETGQHVVRMSRYAKVLARGVGLDDEGCDLIGVASAMHDVGKVGVPDGILFKPGEFTPAEHDVIKQHAQLGYDILCKSDEPLLVLAANIALTHHERWDGAGYPHGLEGTAIPIEGRIAAVADVFDALVSRRVYKAPYPLERSLDIIRAGRGSQFDVDVVDAFFASLDEVVAIHRESQDPL